MQLVMPKDIDNLRKLQREWLRKRREAWIIENGPCRECGSWDRIEVDHIDPSTKVTSSVWSWSKERRDIELAKCQPLCHRCHADKTTQARRDKPTAHGGHGYDRGCRCEICRQWQIDRMARYHADHPRNKKFAAIAQLVERNLAEVEVPGSSSGGRSSPVSIDGDAEVL